MPLTQVDQGLLGQYAQYTGFKNRIINGAMVIDQRNAGASVTPTGSTYTLDRWSAGMSLSSKFSIQQRNGVDSGASNYEAGSTPAGFINSLKVVSAAATSLGSGDIFVIRQFIEGFNTADLNWGTANASTICLSFWVKSSLTGTFGGSIQNGSANRSYPFTYTISSANTWEYKTATIVGDQSGTWNTGNTTSLIVNWSIGTGTTYSGTAGSWAGADYRSATGAVSVVGTSGATFYITGVQLEKGSTATSFDYRPYGTELALCQRYFYKLVGGGSGYLYPAVGAGHCGGATTAYAVVPLPVTMRSSATALHNGTMSVNSGGVDYSVTSLGILYGYGSSQWITLNVSGGGMTTGRGCITYCGASTNDWFQLSSEL